ncbi:MAG TPA: hypothetical protein VMU25_04380 [Candidatus Paceibacterota bacterium]|nr:hypothetical protein [Candidatus Paceibacterota bacterium]
MGQESLASIKRRLTTTAAQCRAEGTPVYIERLARNSGLSSNRLWYLLAFVVPEWKAELTIVDGHYDSWNRSVIYRLYEFAAQLLRKEDRLPTDENLAEMLSVKPNAIRAFIKRHPELARKINFSCRIDAMIYHAGRKIRFRGERVTRVAIARETGLRREAVERCIKRRPEFIEQLALTPCLRRSPDTKKTLTGPVVPQWLKNTIKVPRNTFPASMSIVERILATVCERHGVTPGEILEDKIGGTGNRAAYARILASYFLIEDAKLTAKEAGEVLGGRCAKYIRHERRIILRDIHRSCVQVELQILRNRFSRT